MRGTEHFKKHLSIRTQVDGKTINNLPVEDPFAMTRVSIGFSRWTLLKMLFQRQAEVEVVIKVVSDGVSQGRWFQGADICQRCKRQRIDEPRHGQNAEPGYHHGDERWCEACYYAYERDEQSQPT